MKSISTAIIAVIFSIVSTLAWAGEAATKDDAINLVRTVQKMFKEKGKEATFAAVTNKELNNGELYPFIYNMKGDCQAIGLNKKLVGRNLYNIKDVNGVYIMKEMIKVTKGGGTGWVDYAWVNPKSKGIFNKTSYVENMGSDYLVGVGIYKK